MRNRPTFAQARRILNSITTDEASFAQEHLKNEAKRVEIASRRLSELPFTIDKNGEKVQIDDPHELRVVTLIELSDKLVSSEIQILAQEKFESLLKAWKTTGTNLTHGLMLYRAIVKSDFSFATPEPETLSLMLAILTHEARASCTSKDLCELITYCNSFPKDETIIQNLYQSAAAYRSSGFYDDLQNCASEAEYDALQQDLEFFVRETKFDFSGPLQTVQSDWEEFRNDQSDYEDHMHDQWKEERRFDRDRQGQLDDLFDSLRRPD